MVSFALWKFQQLGQPLHWWLTAYSMKDAADLVFAAIVPEKRKPSEQDLELARKGFELAHPAHDRRSVYVLLAGFSLENLFKAEYMRQHEPSLDEGCLPKELSKHDLVAISLLVNFDTQSNEQKMLAIASEATVSWGRYPSGLRHDKGAMSPPDCLDLEEFKQAFESVYDRLTAVITEKWVDED